MNIINNKFEYLQQQIILNENLDVILKTINFLYNNIKSRINIFTNNDLNEILFNLWYYRHQISQKYHTKILILNNIIIIILFYKNLTNIKDLTLIVLCYDNAGLYEKMVRLKKTTPSHDHLLLALRSISHTQFDTLEKKRCNFNLLRTILNYNVLPTRICLDKLFNPMMEQIVMFGTLIFSSQYIIDYDEKIINLLIESGLKLNLFDVKVLANHSIEIDIEKFNIIPDEELINICVSKQFFPHYLDSCVISQSHLHNLFLSNYYIENHYANFIHILHLDIFYKNINSFIQKLDNFIQKHNLKCDIVCLQNACKFGFTNMIMYLINEQHIVPDSLCLEHVKHIFDYRNPIIEKIANMIK